jgi:hypothetical protein
MEASTNVAVVQRVYEALGHEDIPALLELLTEDVEWVYQGPSVIPFAGTRHGREGVVEIFTLLGETLEFEHFEPRPGFTLILVDEEDAPLRPAQGDGAIDQTILEVGGLAMVHDLLDGRLPDVDHRQPLEVPLADLFGTRHRPGLIRKTIHGHHRPPVAPFAFVAIRCSRSLPKSATRRLRFGGGNSSQVRGDFFFSRGGGNCSVRHAARSCGLSAFREVASFCARSTIPSSPASPIVGRAGGFVFTGVLWLGCGRLLLVVGPEPLDEQGLREAYGDE